VSNLNILTIILEIFIILELLMEHMKDKEKIITIPALSQTKITLNLEEDLAYIHFLFILTPETPFLMKIISF
jgi:hypothetical protein